MSVKEAPGVISAGYHFMAYSFPTTQDEYRRGVIACYYRSTEEYMYMAPLVKYKSLGKEVGLDLVSAENKIMATGFHLLKPRDHDGT